MVAVLVAVGLGTLTPAQVKAILESRDPLGKQQTRVAPAHGLFLKSVLYGDMGAVSACPTVPGLPTASRAWQQAS